MMEDADGYFPERVAASQRVISRNAETAAATSADAFNPPPHSIAVLPFVNMSDDKLHPNAPSDEPRAGRSATFGVSDTGSCFFCGGGAGRPWNRLTGFPPLLD